MIIELISFRYNLSAKKRLEHTVKLINQSDADLVVFSGHTLIKQDDLYDLEDLIENKSSFVLFEVKQITESNFLNLKNCLYVINEGSTLNLFTNQFFSTSDEIEDNEPLCERFLNELETRRSFNVKGKKCLVLQCGEINIIKNLQKEENRPIFRLQQRKDLEERFGKIINNSDIIINPIHTPMGNQGKMKKRRDFFSNDGRYYFSVSQNGTRKRGETECDIPIGGDSLQYSYYNGSQIKESSRDITQDYQKRVFKI